MSGKINLFTPSIGISGVATPRQDKLSLKKQGRVSPALTTSRSRDDLSVYDGDNLDSMLDDYLRVTPEDPDTASPEQFGQAVQDGLQGLFDATGDPVLGEMLKDFTDNNDLLRMYCSLVLGG
ncbi:type III secretion apparatus assembly protein SctX [Desulfocurvus sp. DL9XJH121]